MPSSKRLLSEQDRQVSELRLFWSKVEVLATGCWEWRGKLNADGYGYILVGSRSDQSRKYVFAHRFAFERFRGSIPAGEEIDHLCKHRSCVNPTHLQSLSHLENVRRSGAAEAHRQQMRARTQCRNGHDYNQSNVYLYRGKRYCRACRKKSELKRQRRRIARTTQKPQ